MKLLGKAHRIKTFTLKDAEFDIDYIKKNVNQNWNITTNSLEVESNEMNKIYY